MSDSTAEADREPDRATASAGAPDGRESGLRNLVIVLALAAAFAFVPKIMQRFGTPASGGDAPDFSGALVANFANAPAPAPEQKTVRLGDLRGKPVVLDFWATWCGPCQAASPIVNGIAQRYRERGLVVLGINTSDERGLAERFAAKKGLTFPIVFDERNDIARSYRVENLPTLVVISKEGKIVAVRRGITSDAELDRLVRQVL